MYSSKVSKMARELRKLCKIYIFFFYLSLNIWELLCLVHIVQFSFAIIPAHVGLDLLLLGIHINLCSPIGQNKVLPQSQFNCMLYRSISLCSY